MGNSLEADVKLPDGLGPVAAPVNVNVNRGEEVVIKLTASMKGSGGVFDYSIFEGPKNGQLVIETLTGAFAIVKYVSDPLSPSRIELFKYRARVRGGKYSAPATVRINVLDDPLRLKIPKVIDFGEVVVSQSRILDFQVFNDSKYAFKGSLVLPNEFKLEGGEANLNIGPQKRSTLRIKCTPQEVVGSFQRNLIINGDGVSLSLPLRGVSVSPFKVKEKKVTLEYSNDKFLRFAEISIRNVSDLESSLEVVDINGAFVARPKEMNIGSGETKKIIIEASNEDPSSAKGYVHLRSSVDSQQVEVESPPLPPRLVINGGENLINISSVIGSPLRFKFDIENVGGGSVAVSLTVPDGFRRLNGEGLISLGAKSKSQIQMEFDSERAGDIYDYFDLSWGDNAKRIIVKGNVSDEPKNQLNNKARVKVSPRNKGNGKSANDYDYPILKRIEKQRKVDESLPKISEVELIERDKHSIVLGWSNPTRDEELSDSSALGYVIETRVHRYDKEMKSMIIEWRELGPDYATIQKKGTMVEAKIKGLSPDGKFTFRLFCENEDGAVSVGSVPFQFQTESSFKFTKANWIFLMGAGGAFLALVCIIIRRKGSFKE
ncbi:MAG: hypothetical protein VYC09_03895 [Verrucomicrobiota bacterium]|nr:hypothetical protein [Verrucomicrobiota bacterium]